MVYSLNGGVLVIGSLFWQNDLETKSNDGLRQAWRSNRLDISKCIDVSAPIRYGRFSKEDVYTMIFDNRLSKENFGTAKAIPFKRSPSDWTELKHEVEQLSSVEGQGQRFIKWSTQASEAWCICCICFNPTLDKEIKSDILENWRKALKESANGYRYFSKFCCRFSLNKVGELDIPWPTEANQFDYLIATSTQPRNRKGIDVLTVDEIAEYAVNRGYLKPNIAHGIKTFQDAAILQKLAD